MPSDDDMRAAFMADILANPDDDGPRIVYADWLSERGDPRGELISVQCAMSRASLGERARLANRASDLLYRHGDAWLAEIRQVVRGVTLERGFVASINATGPVFGRCGALFELEPIQELRLINPNARDLATLANAAHLSRLRSLVFLDRARLASERDATRLRALVVKLARLRTLDLRLDVEPEAAGETRAVFATLALGALEYLKLQIGGGADVAIVEALATAKLPALRRLGIHRSFHRTVKPMFAGIELVHVDG